MSVDTFNPVKFSLEENQFLLQHLGEPSSVALKAIKAAPLVSPARDNKTGRIIDRNPIYYPDGVIPASVKPLLDRVYELIDLEQKFKQPWIGLEAVKKQITIYLEQQAKWLADKQRFPSAPRFPSMHSFDAKGRPHRGGPGADCGEVATYFDKEGGRHGFAIDLLAHKETGGWAPEWTPKAPAPTEAPKVDVEKVVKALLVDQDANRIECPVCRHTESFKPEIKSSYNVARARMSKHLRTEVREVALHRELYTNEFGS